MGSHIFLIFHTLSTVIYLSSLLQIILFGILFLFFIILLSDYCPSINRSIVSVSTLQELVCHYLAIAFQNHFSMISPSPNTRLFMSLSAGAVSGERILKVTNS